MFLPAETALEDFGRDQKCRSGSSTERGCLGRSALRCGAAQEISMSALPSRLLRLGQPRSCPTVKRWAILLAALAAAVSAAAAPPNNAAQWIVVSAPMFRPALTPLIEHR